MSFAMLPTVEMEGPAGRVVVNNNPEEIAPWITRGYKVIAGTAKGSVVGVVTSEDLAMEEQAKIDEALEQAEIEKNPKQAPAPTGAKKK